jgi:hypothetical protein
MNSARVRNALLRFETCCECGGKGKVVPETLPPLAGQALACNEDPAVIKKIPAHLQG